MVAAGKGRQLQGQSWLTCLKPLPSSSAGEKTNILRKLRAYLIMMKTMMINDDDYETRTAIIIMPVLIWYKSNISDKHQGGGYHFGRLQQGEKM